MDNNEENTSKENVNGRDLLDKPILFDLERMQKALESETFTLPPGLSRKEMIEFIVSSACKK